MDSGIAERRAARRRRAEFFAGIAVAFAGTTLAVSSLVWAQQPAGGAAAPDDNPAPAAPTVISPPAPAPSAAPAASPGLRPATDATADDADSVAAKPRASASTAAPDKPPEPPKPLRSPAAILQALDKVTAETMRFEAPIGRRIRYKNLVFTVKACETTGLDDPQPQAAAYLVVESQPRPVPGHEPPPTKQVYKGWMFSTAPGLHPFEHPVYDAWLIACSASVPPA
ncbi:DUF2155 domain-containing protein [Caulobacter sp. KR2-114]|uniref:DUF2155 domain-containing protein n=1 Tax=Caulobacter sp. KR2-114 TaxID=3400912 RepID=UPI003C0E1A72